MTLGHKLGWGILFGLAFVVIPWRYQVEATLKYRRDTGKKCVFCHERVPEPGAKDPLLTEDGRRFRDNGYQLTEDQKRRED